MIGITFSNFAFQELKLFSPHTASMLFNSIATDKFELVYVIGFTAEVAEVAPGLKSASVVAFTGIAAKIIVCEA